MLPKSDDLEELYNRARKMCGNLGRRKTAEVTQQGVKDDLAAIARDWLRVSPVIRDAGCCKNDVLVMFDTQMTELLASTTQRARASALKNKLLPFVDKVVDSVIVPVIQVEGSPRQVAARQIHDALDDALTLEESVYVSEAGRCVTVECYRAAIIMLWAAAIARIHETIMNHGFDRFNKSVDVATAKTKHPFKRINSGARITSLPELQQSRDSDLLIVGMVFFQYDLQCYQELDRLLGQRNDCAHPGMNNPGALDVQQFASKLRRLVFDRIRP